MAGYHFDARYCEAVTLRDGRQVSIRLIGPHDKDLFRQGLLRMSPESRFRRFFASKERFTEDELRYFTEVDQINHFAIGAQHTAATGEVEGLGSARFIRCAGLDDTAEAAIAVIDDAQGQGLGSVLLQRLVAAARERGIRRLRFDVLGSNKPMHELLRELAPQAAAVAHEGGVTTLELELPELSPAHPHTEPPRQTALYEIFTMVAKGLLKELPRAAPLPSLPAGGEPARSQQAHGGEPAAAGPAGQNDGAGAGENRKTEP